MIGPFSVNPSAGAKAEALFRSDLGDYLVDVAQRNLLMLDVLRRRGDNYLEHMAMIAPHVLGFSFEPVMSGRSLPRPVNYWLVRIIPPEGVVTNEAARPFIVVDPRAGHGPGIGGMKPDSEIGAALAAGHPCYFIGFLPDPVPGQTIEDVGCAEAAFIEAVIKRHPDYPGKPCVIGNCQAGWAVLGLAAARPDLMGPIMAAGAPLAYWNGKDGLNPMRYSGGMLGGSWLASLTGDLGAGIFDGAYLVQNFEKLNPANTWWGKLYDVWSQVDTEAERFLSFEKWWGGHVLLNREEIEFIVEELFVGNKLTKGEVRLSSGKAIDLREVTSPIVVFCSWGDNITPPQQALGWITDLYASDLALIAAEQTIVYCIHPQAGHLGVFVSSSVAKKEHTELTENMDLIDILPPGLWEAVITPREPGQDYADLAAGKHVLRFEPRKLDDIRALGLNSAEDDRRFATVARLSEINSDLYKTWLRPWVNAVANAPVAELSRRLNPLRSQFEAFSHNNPFLRGVPVLAEQVRRNRRPAAPGNPFLAWQQMASQNIAASLDLFRDIRDSATELLFKQVYGSPALQQALGVTDETARPVPADRERGVAELEAGLAGLRQRVSEINANIAVLRAFMFVLAAGKSLDERIFAALRRLQKKHQSLEGTTLWQFKAKVREQLFMLRFDRDEAVAAIERVLQTQAPPISLEEFHGILTAAGPLEGEALTRYERVSRMFPDHAPEREPPAPGVGTSAATVRAATPKPAAQRRLPGAGTRRRTAPQK
ncbi:MAG: DUF3141 domain-containing protein [Bosea sp.]|uniref:DUF3141 domain-containing protein n=1 Tax=Bosea sp. (in: a-proteobacteria) TaxID=1871050 RepID=UPI001AC875AB|nr:DUF3141 domain-containing protein [Bosea sp. (in: a-proteobacteria)]MBN9471375.1 DUF3141 domain-containing protein [Bosea sp. (in: a-proteobacteria)]